MWKTTSTLVLFLWVEGGYFYLPFALDLSGLLLRLADLSPLGCYRAICNRPSAVLTTPEMEAARELGGKLFEAVFGNEVRACLRGSIDEVR